MCKPKDRILITNGFGVYHIARMIQPDVDYYNHRIQLNGLRGTISKSSIIGVLDKSINTIEKAKQKYPEYFI